MRLEGYVATFGETGDGDGRAERIEPGAFRSALSDGRDIVALMDHDPTRLLGRTKSGSLSLREDTHGLVFSVVLPDTAPGRDAHALAMRGDLGGMSFGFRMHGSRQRDEGGTRVLEAIDLREISAVSAFPAYPGTVVAARDGDVRWAVMGGTVSGGFSRLTREHRRRIAACYGA